MQTKNRFRVQYDRPNETSTIITIRDAASHLSARIEGPFCSIARTLRSTLNFSKVDEELVCQLVDPVFWSPDFPAYYQLDFFDGDQKIDSQRFGVRKLECSRGSLFLNSRRWVLRAAWSDKISVEECRRQNLSIVCDDPSDEFLDRATDAGVFVILNLENCVDWKDRLCQLSRFPCIGITILKADVPQVPNTNQLLAHRCASNSFVPADWAHIVMPEFSALQAQSSTDFSRPVVCYRNLNSEPLTRAACEKLQRDLAPTFDLAGYVISNEVNETDG